MDLSNIPILLWIFSAFVSVCMVVLFFAAWSSHLFSKVQNFHKKIDSFAGSLDYDHVYVQRQLLKKLAFYEWMDQNFLDNRSLYNFFRVRNARRNYGVEPMDLVPDDDIGKAFKQYQLDRIRIANEREIDDNLRMATSEAILAQRAIKK